MFGMNTLARLLTGALLLLVAGCNTTPSVPVKDYVAEADLTAENAASLSGSKTENPNIFSGDLRVYVTHIDNARTQPGVADPDQDKVLLVKPGTHYVRMILTRKDGWRGRSFSACAEQFIELAAGKLYVARGEMKGRDASLWLDEVGSTNEQARAAAGVSITQRVTAGYVTSHYIVAAHPCAK